MVVQNGRVVYTARPTSRIIPNTTVTYTSSPLDPATVPLNGGVLLKTLALSADPYMRYRMRDPAVPMFCPALREGEVLDNFGVAVVVRSEDEKFKEGDFVEGYIDFAEYSIWPPPPERRHFLTYLQPIARPADIPATVYTGTLGLAGKSAWTAYETFARERTMEAKTLFVSAAAGAVGTFVCEYAKVLNPKIKVIGSAGSQEKLDILKKIGVDVGINYKTQDVAAVLKEHGPIDIYWDNVAGSTLDAALVNMSHHGLIIACGAITAASNNGEGSVVRHFEEIFERSLTVKGFICGTGEVAKALPRFYDAVTPLVQAGKITSREHRFEGLREAGAALASVHEGSNVGKAVIVVAEA